jgi:hypothetical protein
MAAATMESSRSHVATRWWCFIEDTWPLDRQVHPSRPEPNRKPGLRLAKHQKSLRLPVPRVSRRSQPFGARRQRIQVCRSLRPMLDGSSTEFGQAQCKRLSSDSCAPCTFNLAGVQLDFQRSGFGYPRLVLKRPAVLCPARYLGTFWRKPVW